MLGDAAHKLNSGHDVGKTIDALKIPYPNDDDRHGPLKKIFYDFTNSKEITSMYPDALLQVPSVTGYNYLPIAPIAINTEFIAYDKRLAKKIGIAIPETSFTLEQFIDASKKIAVYN